MHVLVFFRFVFVQLRAQTYLASEMNSRDKAEQMGYESTFTTQRLLAGTIVERTLAQAFAVLENKLVCGRQNPSWKPLALSNQNFYTIEQSVFVERTSANSYVVREK